MAGSTLVNVTATELEYLGGVTKGTSAASKALVLDASSKIDTLGISQTFTTAGADDWAMNILLTLNDSSAATGTQEARALKVNLATTDLTGWDNVYVADFQVDGVSVFNIDDVGDATFGGDVSIPSGNKLYLDGGGDSYIQESSPNNLSFVANGTAMMSMTNNYLKAGNDGFFLRRNSVSATVPTVGPDKTYVGYGLGGAPASGYISLISNSVEGIRVTESGGGVIPSYNVTSGITASTTQSQGQGALVSAINEVSTVANANDTVTLPSAVSGMKVTIINNGANTLQIFPASGDDLGAGVDTSTTLASGSNVTYAAYDTTNWEAI